MTTVPPPLPDHDPDAIPTDLPKVSGVTLTVIAALILALLAGLFFMGYLPHRARVARLEREAREDSARDLKPVVQVTIARPAPAATDLLLPADARANQATAIYPRANGYIKKVHVDIGDHVILNQLLAEIDTPEVDAQLLQAKAAVAQAAANLGKAQNDFDLAQTTLDRYTGFAKTGGVTQQQLDEKKAAFTQAQATFQAAKATVAAMEADVKRLDALSSWQQVKAPFAGTITARNYDNGALLSPTNAAGKELFRIEQTETLRIYASVPQQYATLVRVGQPAEFFSRNYPGRGFPGTVARTAGSIDPQTRTLRVEVEVKNEKAELYAGMYGQVKLNVTQKAPPLRVPTSALVYNAKGTRVAVIVSGRIQFREIVPSRDLGQDMEIASGLADGDWVVSNPGERLVDGLEVDVAGKPSDSATAAKPAAPARDPKQQGVQTVKPAEAVAR